MKNFFIAVCLVVTIVFVNLNVNAVRIPRYYNEMHTVNPGTTTAIMVGGYQPGRRYYLGLNEGNTYACRFATYSITQADISSGGDIGIPIPKSYGSWEDKYNVYQSSWWVILSSANAVGTDITTTFTWFERY